MRSHIRVLHHRLVFVLAGRQQEVTKRHQSRQSRRSPDHVLLAVGHSFDLHSLTYGEHRCPNSNISRCCCWLSPRSRLRQWLARAGQSRSRSCRASEHSRSSRRRAFRVCQTQILKGASVCRLRALVRLPPRRGATATFLANRDSQSIGERVNRDERNSRTSNLTSGCFTIRLIAFKETVDHTSRCHPHQCARTYEFERLERRFRFPKLCTHAAMRRRYPGHKSYGLESLCEIYGIELDNHHRALCDARASFRAWRRVGLHPVAGGGRHVRFAVAAAGVQRTAPLWRRRYRRGPVAPIGLSVETRGAGGKAGQDLVMGCDRRFRAAIAACVMEAATDQ